MWLMTPQGIKQWHPMTHTPCRLSLGLRYVFFGMWGDILMRRTKDTTRIVTIPELMPYPLVKLPILMVSTHVLSLFVPSFLMNLLPLGFFWFPVFSCLVSYQLTVRFGQAPFPPPFADHFPKAFFPSDPLGRWAVSRCSTWTLNGEKPLICPWRTSRKVGRNFLGSFWMKKLGHCGSFWDTSFCSISCSQCSNWETEGLSTSRLFEFAQWPFWCQSADTKWKVIGPSFKGASALLSGQPSARSTRRRSEFPNMWLLLVRNPIDLRNFHEIPIPNCDPRSQTLSCARLLSTVSIWVSTCLSSFGKGRHIRSKHQEALSIPWIP